MYSFLVSSKCVLPTFQQTLFFLLFIYLFIYFFFYFIYFFFITATYTDFAEKLFILTHNNYSIIKLQNHRYVIEADGINRFKLHGAVTDSTDCYISHWFHEFSQVITAMITDIPAITIVIDCPPVV